MKTSVEHVDEVTVRLTVEVDPAVVTRACERAARELAQQVQIPGFRKGKVPRRLLEARVGAGTVRQHALESSLGELYARAMKAEELDPVAPPELDLEVFDEEQGCRFEATVEVRPEFEVPDHTGIEVTFPEWDVSDEDVDERIDQLRERFAELSTVDRAARPGDYVTLDLDVSVDGQPIERAEVRDALYEVGSGGVTPKLDEELVGCVAGSEFTYQDVLPEQYPEYGGQEAELSVRVSDVRAKHLPDLDDDFAITASRFDTLEELRRDIRDTLLRQRIVEGRRELRNRVAEAYLARVDVTLPPSLVEEEREQRLSAFERQAEQFGMTVDELLDAREISRQELEDEAEQHARSVVKAVLVFEALARRLELSVDADDIEQEIRRHARQHGVDPREIAELLRDQGSIAALVGDILRRKAIDAVVEAAEVEGAPSEEVLAEVGLAEGPAEGRSGEQRARKGLIVPGQDRPGERRSKSGLIVPGQ